MINESLEIFQLNNIKLYIIYTTKTEFFVKHIYSEPVSTMPNNKCRLSTREKQNKHKVCTALIQ